MALSIARLALELSSPLLPLLVDRLGVVVLCCLVAGAQVGAAVAGSEADAESAICLLSSCLSAEIVAYFMACCVGFQYVRAMVFVLSFMDLHSASRLPTRREISRDLPCSDNKTVRENM